MIRPTTIIEAARLSKHLGVNLTVASESFQHTGSFKLRAAYNLASQVPHPHIIAASSGNFGQAMAYACQLLGKVCTVVMPDTSAQVKIEAVREYGGQVDLVNVAVVSRQDRVAQIAHEHPEAFVASAYDDPLVIEGNASLGVELSELDRKFDLVVAPIGGGGMSSGLITGLRRSGSCARVIGAEPLMANRTTQSLLANKLIRLDTEPQTLADGARTLGLGQHNWEILRTGLGGVVGVPEENIKAGVRLLFELANLKAEPTGALSIGAVLTEPEMFRGRAVCCVVTGGNVDLEVYRSLLA